MKEEVESAEMEAGCDINDQAEQQRRCCAQG
jgi:hypothetical protein